MEKEYVIARLFRNREEDCLDTDEESQSLDQQPSTQAPYNETVESNGGSTILSLPERLLCVIKKALAQLLS